MFAKDDNGTLRILDDKVIVGPKGEKWSRQILDMWTPEELKGINIYEIAVDPVPQGHKVVSETLVKELDTVRLVRVTEPSPPPPKLNPVDTVGDDQLKIILSLQNEIRELKTLPALKDVEELKVELKKTVTADAAVAAIEAKP